MVGQKHHLYNKIEYTKTMLITGFLKSTVGTTLIGLGAAVTAYSFLTPAGYITNAPYIGVILILLGFITYFIGDLYKMRMKNKEIEHIDSHIQEQCKEHIQEMALKLAEKIYEEESEKMNNAIDDRFKELLNKQKL